MERDFSFLSICAVVVILNKSFAVFIDNSKLLIYHRAKIIRFELYRNDQCNC